MLLLRFVASLFTFFTESNLHPSKINLTGIDNCFVSVFIYIYIMIMF